MGEALSGIWRKHQLHNPRRPGSTIFVNELFHLRQMKHIPLLNNTGLYPIRSTKDDFPFCDKERDLTTLPERNTPACGEKESFSHKKKTFTLRRRQLGPNLFLLTVHLPAPS